MENKDFHFALPEEHKRFDELSQEEKELLIDKAQEEGLRINEKTEEIPFSSEKHMSTLFWKYKKGIVPIVNKLKDDIEKGVFDTLISDDAGARLPTLILKDILKAKGPQNKELKVRFLALGRSPSYGPELEEYVQKHKDEWGKILLVTEYVGTGNTLDRIRDTFDNASVTDYDVAALFSNHELEDRGILLTNGKHLDNASHRTFTGVVGLNNQTDADILKDWSKPYSGITRTDSPFPMRTDKYKKFNEEGEKIMQMNINLAREAVKNVAQKIIDEVWGQGN